MIETPKSSSIHLMKIIMIIFLSQGIFTEKVIAMSSSKTLANGSLCYVSAHEIELGKPLIVLIPGGPAISGEYMAGFMVDLGKELNANAILLYLPNHDCSYSRTDRQALNYLDTLNIIQTGIMELASRYGRVTLVGHSFGARLAFDVTAQIDATLLKDVCLLNFPITFDAPSRYKEAEQKVTDVTVNIDSNEKFKSYWNNVLPLYFYKDIPDNVRSVLVSPVFWEGNELMDSQAPSVDLNIDLVANKKVPLLFLTGVVDLRLPEETDEWIDWRFPNTRVQIGNSAHFPMLENEEETIRHIKEFLNTNHEGSN